MPLAGRPPYATDEPDSFYQSAPTPQPRLRPSNPNDRSSAYDVYNSYLTDDHAGNRQSGVNALGLGLMNMADDDDDEDQPPPPPSKHAALAAAVAKRPSPAIVAPQPGYAAPIATLNLARPEPVAPKPINFKINSPPNPFADPQSVPTSSSPPIVANEPHPLQPPITPITPVFARPKPNVSFSETAVPRPPKPIVRGNSEDTLLPSRGEKGDDFWRRFSMVVKEENRKSPSQKTSMWLRKTQDGSHRLARWVWITGIIILIIIGVAAGVGYQLSHNTPSHQQPAALGGSANEAATVATSSTSAPPTAGGGTIKHVSPTYTLDGRDLDPRSTPIPALHKRRLHHV
ncbi:hypothetical protein E4T56_gene13232 [Termitomyces sp. T112]|nr:hypothetical protein C0989_000169 [Termitomyces sp. Mn162]KAG5721477.1 hypothetical protein E4T56_gene13232 [Termitomyces sp. T112]KAH0586470.1 hypothetical protein H2248_007702 [Termitomyces sp. 'cryptogamus']KNZ78997.1 hypothetical protein J132_07149 [Termitomyces sp. J132]